MPLRWLAIIPKRQIVATDNIQALVEQYLGAAGFAGAVAARMADYPQQLPAFGSGQSLGKSFGSRVKRRRRVGRRLYRRTGRYGRDWGPNIRVRRRGADFIAETSNHVPYAVFVGGPRTGSGPGRRQTAVMRARGWPNITDVTRSEWRNFGPRVVRVFTQHDPRLRRRPFGR